MTTQQAKQFILQSGLSVACLAGKATDSKTDTMRCVVSCCALECSASASQKYFDDMRDISSIKMAEAPTAANTAPTAHTSTDTNESGTSTTETMAATPTVPTVNKSQLRIKKIPLIAVTSLAMASFSLIFDQISTASPPSALITAAVVLITLSQWSIVYLHFLLPKHLR